MGMGTNSADTVVNYSTQPGHKDQHTYLYGEPFGQELQREIQPEVQRLTGLKLKRSYVSSRKYFKGNELFSHKDRKSCEISVSICLGMSEFTAWPLYADNQPLICKPGDGIIYPGVMVEHWREPLHIDWYSVLLVHYVNADGPHVYSEDRLSDLEQLNTNTRHF
jgi:hypothetical protein